MLDVRIMEKHPIRGFNDDNDTGLDLRLELIDALKEEGIGNWSWVYDSYAYAIVSGEVVCMNDPLELEYYGFTEDDLIDVEDLRTVEIENFEDDLLKLLGGEKND